MRPEIEQRLQAEANARGLALAELARRLIEEHATDTGAMVEERRRRLMKIAGEARALPSLDGRAGDEIIGYGEDGLPSR